MAFADISIFVFLIESSIQFSKNSIIPSGASAQGSAAALMGRGAPLRPLLLLAPLLLPPAAAFAGDRRTIVRDAGRGAPVAGLV